MRIYLACERNLELAVDSDNLVKKDEKEAMYLVGECNAKTRPGFTPEQIVNILLLLKKHDVCLARHAWHAYLYAAKLGEVLEARPEDFNQEEDPSKDEFLEMTRFQTKAMREGFEGKPKDKWSKVRITVKRSQLERNTLRQMTSSGRRTDLISIPRDRQWPVHWTLTDSAAKAKQRALIGTKYHQNTRSDAPG